MAMTICKADECACFHHRLLECVELKLNDEAQELFQRLDNLYDAADTFGDTLPHYSVQHDNIPFLQHLVDSGCKIDAQNYLGVTPLMLAIDTENVSAVEILLKNSIDILVTDSNGISMLQRSFYANVSLLSGDYVFNSDYYLFRYPHEVKKEPRLILKAIIQRLNDYFFTDEKETMRALLNANCIIKLAVVAFCKIELALFVLQNDYAVEFHEPKLELTALHVASMLGKLENAKLLIESGANINALDKSRVTPVMFAVKNGNLTVVELLLKNNADIYATDLQDMSTLQHSFYVNVALFKSANQIWSVVFIVEARKIYRSILEMIMEKVDEEFLADKEGTKTLLLDLDTNYIVKLAVIVFCNIELASFILQNGFAIEFREPQLGWTALHCSVFFGKFENSKLLIEHRVNINALDKTGFSPLHYYPNRLQYVDENSTVLKTFLKYSNNLFVHDEHDISDVRYLLQRGTKETVKTVLESGIDIDAGLNNWPLQFVLMGNKILEISEIIELGIKIDVNSINPVNKFSVLKTEVYRKNFRAIEYLLEHGADLNYFEKDGYPIMFYAARFCVHEERLRIAELLLQFGAEVQFTIENGITLIDDILENHKESIKLLMAHCAMLAAIDESALTQSTRNSIKSHALSKSHFDSCSKQLEELKKTTLYETITLFQLLHVKEETFVGYMRNEDFIAVFKNPIHINNVLDLEPYYLNTLQRRVTKAVTRAKVEEILAQIIEVLTGFDDDAHHIIVYKIVCYLNFDDFCKLQQVLPDEKFSLK